MRWRKWSVIKKSTVRVIVWNGKRDGREVTSTVQDESKSLHCVKVKKIPAQKDFILARYVIFNSITSHMLAAVDSAAMATSEGKG